MTRPRPINFIVGRILGAGSLILATGACSGDSTADDPPSSAPVVTAVSPNPVPAGALVTVSGSRLDRIEEVRWGAEPVQVTRASDQSLQFTAPTFPESSVGCERSNTLRFVHAAGTVDSTLEVTRPPPTISNVAISGDRSRLTVFGSGLDRATASLNGTRLNVESAEPNRAFYVLPRTFAQGAYTLRVTDCGDARRTVRLDAPPPQITQTFPFEPIPGEPMVVAFDAANPIAAVEIDGMPADIEESNFDAGLLLVRVPPNLAPGDRRIVLFDNQGEQGLDTLTVVTEIPAELGVWGDSSIPLGSLVLEGRLPVVGNGQTFWCPLNDCGNPHHEIIAMNAISITPGTYIVDGEVRGSRVRVTPVLTSFTQGSSIRGQLEGYIDATTNEVDLLLTYEDGRPSVRYTGIARSRKTGDTAEGYPVIEVELITFSNRTGRQFYFTFTGRCCQPDIPGAPANQCQGIGQVCR